MLFIFPNFLTVWLLVKLIKLDKKLSSWRWFGEFWPSVGLAYGFVPTSVRFLFSLDAFFPLAAHTSTWLLLGWLVSGWGGLFKAPISFPILLLERFLGERKTRLLLLASPAWLSLIAKNKNLGADFQLWPSHLCLSDDEQAWEDDYHLTLGSAFAPLIIMGFMGIKISKTLINFDPRVTLRLIRA